MKKLLLLIIAVFMISGCSLFKGISSNTGMVIPVKKMGLMLNDSLRIPSLKNKETGVLTFVNLNELDEAEPLGRYLQDRISYYLFENGFRLKELRMGKQNTFIPKTGEINITRLKSELKDAGYAKLESIIVGTYIDAGQYYYVSVKLIELKNSLIRASGEMKVEKGKYLSKLISFENKENKSKEVVYERIPLKVDAKL